MTINVGTTDRLIRVVAGIAFVVFAAVSHGYLRWLGAVGIVLILTGTISFCPAYWLLRIRTIGKQQRSIG
jgi:ABC-type tungstate transport system substrate-binding protein